MSSNSGRIEVGATTTADPLGAERLSDWMEIAVVVAISLLSTATGQLLEANSIAERSVAFAGILIALAAVLMFHWRRRDDWGELGLARPRRWWKAVLLALPAFVIVMLMVGVFQTFVVAPLTRGETADISRFNALRGNLPRLLLSLVSVWVTAAFAEEVVYRGFLMGRLARLLGGGRGAWWGALVLSSVLFGLLHVYQGLAGVLVTGFVGFLAGVLYLVFKRNLWIPILVHGLIDTMSLTAVYLGVAS